MLLPTLLLAASLGAPTAAPPGFVEHGGRFCSSLPNGTRLFSKHSTTVVTVDACAQLCTATPTCVCFDYKEGDKNGCRGVNKVKLKPSGDYCAYANISSPQPPPWACGRPRPAPPPPPKPTTWSQLWLDYR